MPRYIIIPPFLFLLKYRSKARVGDQEEHDDIEYCLEFTCIAYDYAIVPRYLVTRPGKGRPARQSGDQALKHG
jgi:hypothetical protein